MGRTEKIDALEQKVKSIQARAEQLKAKFMLSGMVECDSIEESLTSLESEMFKCLGEVKELEKKLPI